jgi:hypothetical protein
VQRRGREIAPGHARDPEVDQARAPARFDQDVLGLDVAVQDPRLVRGLHRVAHLQGERDRLDRGEPTLARVRRQRAALDVFHREPRPLAAVHALDPRFVDLRDPRMPQPPERLEAG